MGQLGVFDLSRRDAGLGATAGPRVAIAAMSPFEPFGPKRTAR